MRLPVAPEGIPFIAGCSVVTLVFALGYPPLALVGVICTSFVCYFFRDPERIPACGDDEIISPADGTILSVATVEEPTFRGEDSVRISIFMSVFDVHVNRAPVTGRLVYDRYNPGKFELAWRDKASEINEQHSFGIESRGHRILVRLIAGYVARRIVPYVRPECDLLQGQRIGMIRFGSRVDIFLPSHVEVCVKQGQKVYAGSTVLGVLS